MLLLHASLWLSGTIPTVEIAPSVRMPFVTLGGVNRSLYPDYPDYSNYSLWLQLGGRGFDSAWEYRTQGGSARAMVKSGITRSELFLTTKIPGSLHGGCCGCPGAGPPGTCLAKCHGVCFPASGHYTAKDATRYIREDLATLRNNGVEYVDLLLLHEPCDYLAPYPYNASAECSQVYGAMEAALTSDDPELKGRIRALGVSNFDATMLQQLARITRSCRRSTSAACPSGVRRGHPSTASSTTSPIGVLYVAGNVKDRAVSAIAAAHGVSNAAVVMRWVTQLGVPLVTASESAAYDRSDMAIFDFELTEAEMETLTKL